MTIVVNDIIQAVANFSMPDGELAKNVYYMQITNLGGVTQTQVRTQIRNYLDYVMDGLGNEVSGDLVAGICDIYRRNTGTDQWDREGGSSQQWSSANPGAPCSNQETGVVFADTANARVTARKSFPGMLQASLSVNTWSVDAQNALSAAATRWINPANDEDIELVAGCWSTKNNAFFPFTGSGTTKALVGSQDTRKP